MTLCALLSMSIGGHAADDDPKSTGLIAVGNAYTALPDDAGLVWSNPSVMALTDSRGAAGISYHRLFELDELEEVTGAIRHRIVPRITLGVGLSRFGESGLYQETRAAFAAGYRIHSRWSLGATWQVQSIEFGDDLNRVGGSHLDLSLAAKPHADWLAGLSVRQIVLNKLYQDGDSGPIAEAAVSWTAPPDITIGGIWTHERDDDHFGLGQRLRVATGIDFLAGLRFKPTRYSLGGRFSQRGIAVEYAYLSHPDLGGTSTFGVSMRW